MTTHLRALDVALLRDAVADLCQRANYELGEDVQLALQASRRREENPLAERVLDTIILNARIALGSVAATPIRSLKAEALLKGKIAEETSFYEAGEKARFEDCKPIDDFRGSAAYRRAMVGVLTKRTLTTAFELAGR